MLLGRSGGRRSFDPFCSFTSFASSTSFISCSIGVPMPHQHQLKSISKAGIPEAVAKVELYRYLNEPEEAESICRDILAIDADHQLARRMLGLAITDQFTGAAADRYREVEEIFQRLADRYEQLYYSGIYYERR